MKIEKLEVSQHLDTRKLYEEVFSEDEKSFVDYYYQEKTGYAAFKSIYTDGQWN